jgi:two-component system, NtrC family, sensor histidine kinase KinB
VTVSLRTRIRGGALGMLVLGIALGLYAMPRILELGQAIREVLNQNYISIQAGMHMRAALHRLQVAELHGDARPALAGSREEFLHWMNIENHSITEVGETELAHDLESRGNRLFAEIAAAPSGSRHEDQFNQLQAHADDLIKMNQAAMFRDDQRARHLSARLVYTFAVGLPLLMVLGIALSWTLGRAIARPLEELAELLRGVSGRKAHMRLAPQQLVELNVVAQEFNRMAEQLEYYDRVNLEQLLYEKSKVEAIVESLEDGVVLIDSAGIVVHINEVATIIMRVERNATLGRQFDGLSNDNPHYVRVRDALRRLRTNSPDTLRVEMDMQVRSHEHSYVLKLIDLGRRERAIGHLLILQDITYLRDQDRARTNLFGTLSHELRTPLTSLALAAELLSSEGPSLSEESRGVLLGRVLDETGRLRQLANSMLDLARGQIPPIAMQRVKVDLAEIAQDVTNGFRVQAHQKGISLKTRLETVAEIGGDPEKLTWVVSNLVGNALRYTPAGGSIEVATRSVQPALVQLDVTDSGPGVPPELRNHIFERFAQYQADGHAPGAAGLGLAIVKEIVEAHGGRIFVDSNYGHGSRFVVQLPTRQEA